MERVEYTRDRIYVNQNIRFGKPCIRGTRIAVEDILNLFKAGYTFEEILKQYPEIEEEDIKAALEYAASVLGKEEVHNL
ncbi:MAG: DUF433 domain-containing protein [Archaeoglobaceae archaeon]